MRASHTVPAGKNIVIDWGFAAEALLVVNATSSTLYLRLGGTDAPDTAERADVVVFPSTTATVPISSPTRTVTVGWGEPLQPDLGLVGRATLFAVAHEPLPTVTSLPVSIVRANITGTVNANITNSALDVNIASGTVNANITNATISTEVVNTSPIPVAPTESYDIALAPGRVAEVVRRNVSTVATFRSRFDLTGYWNNRILYVVTQTCAGQAITLDELTGTFTSSQITVTSPSTEAIIATSLSLLIPEQSTTYGGVYTAIAKDSFSNLGYDVIHRVAALIPAAYDQVRTTINTTTQNLTYTAGNTLRGFVQTSVPSTGTYLVIGRMVMQPNGTLNTQDVDNLEIWNVTTNSLVFATQWHRFWNGTSHSRWLTVLGVANLTATHQIDVQFRVGSTATSAVTSLTRRRAEIWIVPVSSGVSVSGTYPQTTVQPMSDAMIGSLNASANHNMVVALVSNTATGGSSTTVISRFRIYDSNGQQTLAIPSVGGPSNGAGILVYRRPVNAASTVQLTLQVSSAAAATPVRSTYAIAAIEVPVA